MWPFRKKSDELGEGTFSPAVLGSSSTRTPSFTEAPHPFQRKFEIEIESWCFGLEQLKEPPLPQVLFKVIRELRGVLLGAIEAGYAFDIRITAEKLFFAAKKTVPQKEILFALLAILPDPESLPVEQKRIFSVIVAQVEMVEGGAVQRMRQRWNLGKPQEGSVAAIPTSGAAEHSR